MKIGQTERVENQEGGWMERLAKFILVLMLVGSPGISIAAWSSNFVEMYQGKRFQLGDDFRRSLVFEHRSGWMYGENKAYFEVLNPLNTTHRIAGELSPSISLSKMAKRTIGLYPVIDTLLTAQLVWDELGDRYNHFGFTFYLDGPVEYVKYHKIGIYSKKNPEITGSTFSIQWAGQLNPTRVAMWSFFMDWVPKRHSIRSSHFLFKTDVMFDLGRAFYKRHHVYIGPGLQYWRNKLGFRNTDEKAWTLRLRVYL